MYVLREQAHGRDFNISMSLTIPTLILDAKEKNNYNSETKDIKIDCGKKPAQF